jgi:hypothetical protein
MQSTINQMIHCHHLSTGNKRCSVGLFQHTSKLFVNTLWMVSALTGAEQEWNHRIEQAHKRMRMK